MASYQSNLLGDFFRRQGQRRALTGLPSSYQEQRGTLDPILAYDAQKSREAGLLAQNASQFDRQMQLQEKARKDQATAGMVGGVGQLAMLPLAYKSAQDLGWVGNGLSKQGLMDRSLQTQAMNDATRNAATSTITPSSLNGPGYYTADPNSASGLLRQQALSSPGSSGPASLGAVPSTAQGAAAASTTAQVGATGGSAAYTGSTGTAAYGAAEGSGAAGVLGAEGGGLLGTAGTVAGPAALGAGIGMFGMNKLLGTGKPGHQGGEVTTSNIAGGIIGGAIAGAAATSWSGPGAIVGGVIGGIIGGISSLF